ncbi:MAG: LysR substrate-binding domain-containing protein [Gammaproteobacteria bacterium]|nr:LysR substrate-binding domain-containing protein [Gammaproteobacteria bacterium]
MKLQQLRYILEVARSALNISTAATTLHTSQPAVSKQIQQLEEELGVQIFARNGKRLTEITPPGQQILQIAERILRDTINIQRVAEEFANETTGTLSIATTHTQARYVLPDLLRQFHQQYPLIRVDLHIGGPTESTQWLLEGRTDLAILTEETELNDDLVALPCEPWDRCLVVPLDHPLSRSGEVTMKQLARHPIATYAFALDASHSPLERAFAEHNLTPNISFAATDSDVIKTYVRQGLGVGVIANQAYDASADGDLVQIDASHLFDRSTTRLVLRRSAYLRGFIYTFLQLYAPYLKRQYIDAAMHI